MKPERKTILRKLLWHGLMALCTLIYAGGLALACEAAGRTDFDTFRTFLQTDMGRMAMVNTALLATLLILGLYFLTTKISAAMVLVSVPLLVFHLINAFKLALRSEPFYPWDFTLAGEATDILSAIELRPSKVMLLAGAYIAASAAVALTMDLLVLRRNRPRYRVSLAGFAACMVVFVLAGRCWFAEDYIKKNTAPVRTYNQELSYRESGWLYAFAANYYHARIEPPAQYSREQMTSAVEGCEGQTGSVRPNVIIVMSEAFADIWNAQKLQFDEALAPTFTALAEQYLSGCCMTSEFGGNTANCEFEVLTGYSTALLPSGTVAYMSSLNRQTDSYVSFLKDLDYYTVALHPYRRSFFSREKAFALLGFDDFYSEEHFQGAERLRAFSFVSDDAVADRIIAEYEKNRPTGRGFFCHTVTMLNHTAYYASDWTEEQQVGMTADCELSEDEFAAIRSYATGLQYADRMLAKLVDYFGAVDEPTVILFFGDHQPSLSSPGYELMQRIGYVADNTTAEGKLALQSTPYLIWNNFQTEPTAARMDMSMFHLIPYMTRMLDMDRPGFHSCMDALFTQVRGVTRRVSLTGAGEPVLTLPEEEQKVFDRYLELVYDGLLGERYASESLYANLS